MALAVVVEVAGLGEEIQPRPLAWRGAMLPRFQRVTDPAEVGRLPRFEAPASAKPDDGQMVLPGFTVPAACPSWLLALFDQAGGASDKPGRGAPWDLRVFVGAVLSVPVGKRTGLSVNVPILGSELAAWLYPNGWANRRRDWQKFRAAMRGLSNLRVPYPWGNTVVRVVTVDALAVPDAWDGGAAPFVFRCVIPASAAHGAPVDWERLRQYGAESAPLYRAYLAVSAVLDYAARDGHGITREIAAPILTQSGRPKRRDGRIVRSPVERVPNPAARYVGALGDEDLRQMVGLHADHRQNRKRAREAVERLATDGVIDLVKLPDGRVRIFGVGRSPVEDGEGAGE